MLPATFGWAAARRVAHPLPSAATFLGRMRRASHPFDVELARPRLARAAGHLRLVLRDLAIAASATFGAYALLEWALPAHASAATYATASAAVAIAALWAGVRTGLLATGITVVVAANSYLAPVGSLTIAGEGDRIGLVLFVVNGLILSLIGGSVRSARVQRRADGPSTSIPAPIASGPSGTPARRSASRAAGRRGPAITIVGEHLIERLTDRELEVLELLAGGLSNTDIADTLVVSLNTVKSHLKSIFGKLGVVSRTQAVVRAGELGLLEADARLTSQSAA